MTGRGLRDVAGATRLALILLLAAALLRSLGWMALLPPWQGPDEPAHYEYVERLAHGDLPFRQQDTTVRSQALEASVNHWALGSIINHSPDRPLDAASRARLPGEAPNLSQAGHGAEGAASYPPGYYVLAVPLQRLPFLHTATARLYAIRLVSVLAGAALCLTGFLLVLQATQDERLSLLAALLLGLPPMLSQSSATANPDILLAALSGALAVACLRARARGPGVRSLAWVAGWMAAMAVTKPVGAGTAAIIAAALLVVPELSRRLGPWVAVAATAAGALLLAAAAVAAFGAHGVTRLGPYGAVHDFARYLWHYYTRAAPGQHVTQARFVFLHELIGYLGWLNVPLPDWAYTVAIYSTPVALAVGIAAALRVAPRPAALQALGLVGSCMAAAVGLLGLLGLLEFTALENGQAPLLQGRYLLPLAPLWVLGVLAPLALAPPRLRYGVAGALTLCWVLVALAGLRSGLVWYAT